MTIILIKSGKLNLWDMYDSFHNAAWFQLNQLNGGNV